MAYDGIGRLVSVTDANGHKSTSAYDALSRLIKTVDPLGDTTEFRYSPVGPLKTTDAKWKNLISYVYDAANNLTRVTDAAGHVDEIHVRCR